MVRGRPSPAVTECPTWRGSTNLKVYLSVHLSCMLHNCELRIADLWGAGALHCNTLYALRVRCSVELNVLQLVSTSAMVVSRPLPCSGQSQLKLQDLKVSSSQPRQAACRAPIIM